MIIWQPNLENAFGNMPVDSPKGPKILPHHCAFIKGAGMFRIPEI